MLDHVEKSRVSVFSMTTTETTTDIESQKELEFDQHLFEMFMSDHIENQVQRLIVKKPEQRAHWAGSSSGHRSVRQYRYPEYMRSY